MTKKVERLHKGAMEYIDLMYDEEEVKKPKLKAYKIKPCVRCGKDARRSGGRASKYCIQCSFDVVAERSAARTSKKPNGCAYAVVDE